MSLTRRLRALEARLNGLLTEEPPCPSCGGPDPKRLGIAVLDVDKGEDLRRCPACSRPLDEQGRDLGEHWSVVYLHHGRWDVPRCSYAWKPGC